MKRKANQLKGLWVIVLAALFVQMQLACAQQSEDQSGQTGVTVPSGGGGSSIGFQADLFTGRFSYSIPIKVAPARKGAQPKLALGYNSASGNGWCGVGWSLETAYIQRELRNGVPVQWSSGTDPLSQYDDSKGFVAYIAGAGNPLVRVGPTNQNPIVYRQQVDVSFLTFNYYTNNHWEIVDKGGNTFYFGEGATNQMENPESGWTANKGSSTFRWALDKVIDAGGNETFLRYTTDSGMLYLTNILYNANTNSPAVTATHEVDFILTNRPDTNITFVSGYRVQVQKLLSEIQIKVSGSNVRKYVIGYVQSPSTLRSMLTSVTEYGSDFSSSLPPITFNYQVKPFLFGPATNWPGIYSQGQTNSDSFNGIRDEDVNFNHIATILDINGDGLPDRVMRKWSSPYTNYFAVQLNTGTGFALANTNYQWGPLDSQSDTNAGGNSPDNADNQGHVYTDIVDINGDGYPDRVMRGPAFPHAIWRIQFNTGIQGTNSFSLDTDWTPVDSELSEDTDYWGIISSSHKSALVDINGDGLPDRVLTDLSAPFNKFKVQLNTGNGFISDFIYWNGIDGQGDTSDPFACNISTSDGNGNLAVTFQDINGDGLPDHVMRKAGSPFNKFKVQFNNGAGFEPSEDWGPLDSQGQPAADWNSPVSLASDTFAQADVLATLVDINGDGLPDRVETSASGPYTNWWVQLNTGSGFTSAVQWTNIDGLGNAYWAHITHLNPIGTGLNQHTTVDLIDINGDGLPDRVMRQSTGPYDHWVVQLNQGPAPDLLNVISNGLGGSVQVSYVSSTTLDNQNTNWVSDRWAEGTKCLLPMNVWVVSQITASDGMGNVSTNTYSFKGGYYNASKKEFRGFSQATVTDPLGAKSITYFHQSGGRDNSALGEYLDQNSIAKKGIPFRIDVLGTNGATNSITLNKVEEVTLNSNGWYFSFISQSIVMTYGGLGSCRSVAKQFGYDTNNENLTMTASLGEVTNIVIQGQSFTDVGSDSVYTWFTYTNIGNISDKPSDTKTTSDSAGVNRLREMQISYDSRGKLIQSSAWLDTAGAFITTAQNVYDQYGNVIQTTDAAGITTTTAYDSTYQQYPIAQVTGTFTNSMTSDVRSGATLMAIDAKGLVVSNTYDAFFRPTVNYTSTNAYGAPTLWKSKMFYSFGGISNGISYNFIHSEVNDSVDTANGYEAYTYSDGIGRTIQTREEAETSGQFRVQNAVYDLRGNSYFQTLPYISSGGNFTTINGTYLGGLTEYDNFGRAFRTTEAVQGNFTSGQLQSTTATGGDTGSPVGSMTTAFVDGNNPWAAVVTDSEGKVKKTYNDAYARTIKLTEVTTGGSYDTTYTYDIFGNLTNVTDNAGNITRMVYDNLGRKTSMVDPDMGTWTYSYDNAGRMIQQIDARTNKITFAFSDQLGRLTSKQIYNSTNSLVGTITYTYDVSDDPNYTVFKGQLYKVTDLQGYERSSYDVRGRVLKNSRFLNLNSMEYVTQSTYDDADRVQQLTYPGNSAVVQYTYDTAGNMVQIKSLAGTGTQEIFYTPVGGFNELGQLLSYTNGNGVLTTNIYYANSKRPMRIKVSKGTNVLQDLSYTYDTVSQIKSISDGVYAGSASASVSSIAYDDLYRLTSLNSTARGIKNYAYNSIGNVLTNQDSGSGLYQYGVKPHAVTNANGMAYTYDACGNMTARGSQTLAYDEQNELVQVSSVGTNVLFGYDDGGERLWRLGTNGYTIWIGGIYEINNGKVLCHVVGGGLIATFEPQCGGLWSKAIGEKNWYVASAAMQSIFNWPFKNGRGQTTIFIGSWTGVFTVCWLAGRRIHLKRYEVRKAFRLNYIWRQAVTFVFISAFLWTSTGNADAATFNPVFYYYHSDRLSSSNILTDRSGSLVQHYEYATFGQTSYQNNTSAFPVSNRYTGQIADDETGLYYYGARYYDPQLGRFIQPDTEVQSPDSQSLNRYSYCGNNPLNCVDPSGHEGFSLATAAIIVIVATLVGGAAGAVISAATGGDPARGALGGAIAGCIAGIGIAGGIGVAAACGYVEAGVVTSVVGDLIIAAGGAVGGAAGGAASAAATGGDIGMSALIGGVSGAVFGFLDSPTVNLSVGSTSSLAQHAGEVAVPATQKVAQDSMFELSDWAQKVINGFATVAKAVGSIISHIPDVFISASHELTAAGAASLTAIADDLSIAGAFVQGAGQGFLAALDGANPFGNPFGNAGLYDTGDSNFKFSQKMGMVASFAVGGEIAIAGRVALAGRGVFSVGVGITARSGRYWAGAGRALGSNEGGFGRYYSELIARNTLKYGKRYTPDTIVNFLTTIPMQAGRSQAAINFFTGQLTHLIP